MAVTVASIIAKLGADTRDFDRGMSGAERKLGALDKTTRGATGRMGRNFAMVGKLAGAAAIGAGVAIGAMATKALGEFASFEKGMNEVFTLLPGISKRAMDKMSEQALELSKDMGVLPDDVVPALYQALSAGVPPDNVFEFLETATKASIGGLTTLETAVDGITSVVNAYGASNISAAQASDLMFTAVKLGKTDFDQLSRSLFQVTPVAAGLGIGFDNVTAALAALTAQGVPTRVASTQIRQAMVELGKEGTIASDKFKELSGETFRDFIAGGGDMKQAFDIMKLGADNMGVGVGDLFGSVEAGMAVIALTSDSGSAAFGKAMTEMQDSAGATEKAFDTMDQGVSRTMDELKAALAVEFVNLGEALVPAFEALIPLMESLVPLMAELAPVIAFVFNGLADLAVNLNGILNPMTAAERNAKKLSDMMGQLNDQIDAGRDPVLVAADVMGNLAGEYALTADNISDLQAATGLSNDEMLRALKIVKDNAAAYGLLAGTSEDAQHGIDQLAIGMGVTADEMRDALNGATGVDQALRRLFRLTQREIFTDELGEGAAAAAWELWQLEHQTDETAGAVQQLASDMKRLADPFFNAIEAADNLAEVMAEIVDPKGAGGIEITAKEYQKLALAILEADSAAEVLNEPGGLDAFVASLVAAGTPARMIAEMLKNLGVLDGSKYQFVIEGVYVGPTSIAGGTGSTFQPVVKTTTGTLIGHEGGIVPGPRGQEVLSILKAGEMVTPMPDSVSGKRGGMGGGDVYVTVEGSVITERDLAATLANELAGMRAAGSQF